MAQSGEVGSRTSPAADSVPPILVPMHGLTRYLRASLGVTGGVMTWDVPRTLVGLVHTGMRRIRVPVAEIASVTVGRAVRPFRLLVGVAVVAVPWFFLAWWAAVPLTGVGLWIVLASLGPRIEAVTHDGRKHRADVCFGHQLDADLYLAALDDLREAAV